VPALRSLRERFRSYPLGVPVSDEFVESQGFDLVHFPTQVAYKTSLPSIYQPHDLQHLHYPQYFRKDEFAQRESWYRAFCAQATFVCVQTQWTKADVVAKYNLRPETVAVIPWGVALDHDLVATKPTALKRKYKVGDRFFFYPAVTWPHKNHLCLLHALRTLRDEHNLTPSLVCTGAVTSYHKVLARAASETGIADQVRYLGFVPIEDLQGLYDAATAMVYPSRFEGFGLPILEAFHAGTPVLCSNSSVLPEVAQDGALYFDPDDAGELAALMFQVLQRAQTRTDLAEAGRRVVSQYSFENTARQFQALYRRCVSPVAGKLSNTLTCAN
jgi:glycosyltransferase involved in cell wall biosynthesis